jgi:hypothetical protein
LGTFPVNAINISKELKLLCNLIALPSVSWTRIYGCYLHHPKITLLMNDYILDTVSSIWLRHCLFGEFLIEDINDPCLEMLGVEKKQLLDKNFFQSQIFETGDLKTLSPFILKTALEFVGTYKCPKKIEKYHHVMVDTNGETKEFTWEVSCHPLIGEGHHFIIRLDIVVLKAPDGDDKLSATRSII